jgi:hypothetical protein
MKEGSQGRAAGKDELGQGGEIGFTRVDGSFQAADLARADRGLGSPGDHSFAGIGKLRADGQEVALDPPEQGREVAGRGSVRPRDAEQRVQLVDVPIGGDPEVIFANPRAPQEAGLAPVSGSRVDLHRRAGSATTVADVPPTSTPVSGSAWLRWM